MLTHRKVILVTGLLIFVPFIESLLPNFFALYWQSPKTMYAWSEYFRPVKLILIFAGFVYLTVALGANMLSQMNKKPRVFFLVISYIVFLVQVPFLLLGLYVGNSSESHLDYLHKEIHVEGRVFYVYTADPGAMGTASHQLYLKCPRLFNRYHLTFISRLDWIKGLNLEAKGKQLLLKVMSQEESVDVSEYHCDEDQST